VALLEAVAASAAVGLMWAGWLANRVGPGEAMLWVVAGAGLVTWGGCWLGCRAAGLPLVAEVPEARPAAAASRPWLRPPSDDRTG
jgi:hypothetical protein